LKVRVSAPSRLHFGFLNLSDAYYKMFGGVGLAIKKPRNVFIFEKCNQVMVDSGSRELQQKAKKIVDLTGIPGIKVEVEEEIPSHKGFGSGTSATLSILSGAKKLYEDELDWNIEKVAADMGRFKYSNVGLNTFKYGGFVVEGGSKDPIYRTDFPKGWKVLLVTPNSKGVSGREEEELLTKIIPVSKDYTGRVTAEVFCRMIPSIGKDIDEFGTALHNIQETMGDVFEVAQDGRYSTENGQKLVSKLKDIAKGVGQSSWGPTIYQILPSKKVEEARKRAKEISDDVMVTTADNTGSTIDEV